MIVAEGLPSARAGWNGILIHAADAGGVGGGRRTLTQSETFEAEQPHRLPLATIAIERIPQFRRVALVAVVLVGGGWGVHADKKQ